VTPVMAATALQLYCTVLFPLCALPSVQQLYCPFRCPPLVPPPGVAATVLVAPRGVCGRVWRGPLLPSRGAPDGGHSGRSRGTRHRGGAPGEPPPGPAYASGMPQGAGPANASDMPETPGSECTPRYAMEPGSCMYLWHATGRRPGSKGLLVVRVLYSVQYSTVQYSVHRMFLTSRRPGERTTFPTNKTPDSHRLPWPPHPQRHLPPPLCHPGSHPASWPGAAGGCTGRTPHCRGSRVHGAWGSERRTVRCTAGTGPELSPGEAWAGKCCR